MSQREFNEYLETFCQRYQKEKEEALTLAIIKEVQKEIIDMYDMTPKS